MVDTLTRPALTLEEAKKRAAQAVAEQEARLQAAQEDLAHFESNMGRLALQGDPNKIAVTLAAKKELISVASAALEAVKSNAANPRLEPRVEIIYREEEQRADLYRQVAPLNAEMKSLSARMNELRPQAEGMWTTINILTRSIESRWRAIGVDYDSQWETKLAEQFAKEEAEANHD